jgi:hypothetical protein
MCAHTCCTLHCTALQAGKENLAAFMESQRVSAMKGATTEWEKLEGFTFSEWPEGATAHSW